MIRLSTLVIMVLSAAAMAQQPTWHGQLLLFDGSSIMPNASIPTPAEVSAVAAAAGTASADAQGLATSAAALRADATRLDIQAAALDGAALVYGACVKFGAQAVETPTNVTATVVDFNFPSNGTSYVQLYVHYSDAMADVWPMVASSLSAQWQRADAVESVLGTWTIGGQPVEAYRMLVPTGDSDTMFFRGSGEVRQSVVGQLNVLDGLTINGRAGLTTTNSIGVFYQGLLVEPLLVEPMGVLP